MAQNLQDDQLNRTKEISRTIRQAIRNSLPGSPDQFLTMMIPGKVLNFDQLCKDFEENGTRKTALPSREVQLAEAILCDDMPTLGPLQLGPTGRSVSRSYAAALSKLCPSGSTTGISDEIAPGTLSPAEKRYQHAMDWLTFRDPNNKNKTRVDLYREKQLEYTNAFERKTKAFREALDDVSKAKDKTVSEQREEYDKWVAENYKTFNNLIQAAYMDWVTMGKKEEVEYYFSIVDNDSAMARVEASKESMRLSVVTNEDGSSEYQRVRLDPDNWALFARNKADAGSQDETVESLTFQISRLDKINFLLNSMKAHTDLIPMGDSEEVHVDGTDDVVKGFLEARKNFEEHSATRAKSAGGTPATPGGDEGGGKTSDHVDKYEKAQKALQESFKKVDEKNVKDLSSTNRDALKKLIDAGGQGFLDQIKENDKKIEELKTKRDGLQKESGKTDVVAATVQDELADKAGIPRAPPRAVDAKKEGSWTSISLDMTSSSSRDAKEESATAATLDVSYGWGWNKISASVSHQQSQADAFKEMASATIKISFECMRVDITRPWLRAELFYDHDLRVPEKTYISPGNRLAALIDLAHPDYKSISDEKRKTDMDNYDLFPMYPTAFLIAANVVLEIFGASSAIQSHLSSSSTSGSVGINYGPFSLGGSAAHSKNSSETTCKTTASGCRITIKSPQIIGWISQIVPELPRPKNGFVPDH